MMMTSHDGPDDLGPTAGNNDEWAQAITETPLFKEKLPSVFEALASSLTERSANAGNSPKRKRTRRSRGDNRRVGSWRWFAWSTAMAVVMAMLATLFLHSWVEERATAKAAAHIAEMENASRLRIQEDAEFLQGLVDDSKRAFLQTGTIFRELIASGEADNATVVLYVAAQQIQAGMNAMEVIERYQIAVENLLAIEEGLMDLEIPEDLPSELESSSDND